MTTTTQVHDVLPAGGGYLGRAAAAGVPHAFVGSVTADARIVVPGVADVLLSDLRTAHEGFFPDLMRGELAA